LTQGKPPLKENGQYNLFFVAENNTIKSAKNQHMLYYLLMISQKNTKIA